jgi:predicted PurR-regulated permease PerM
MSIIGILIALVIICLLWWAVNAILRAFGVGDPIATLVKVVFVVLVVLWLLSAVFGYGPTLHLR